MCSAVRTRGTGVLSTVNTHDVTVMARMRVKARGAVSNAKSNLLSVVLQLHDTEYGEINQVEHRPPSTD